jgi:hypothetical protein
MSPDSKGPVTKPAAPAAATATDGGIARIHTAFNYDHRLLLVFFALILMGITATLFLFSIMERSIYDIPITADMDIDNVKQIFPTTADGKFWAPVPLTEPALTTPELLQWVVDAAADSYTLNFLNYEKVISKASAYYTKIGYQHYRRALVESGFLASVQKNKYVSSVVPISAPTVLKEKPAPDGTYSWQVQVPIRVTLNSGRGLDIQNITLTMAITRVSFSESPDGIAIAALIVRKDKSY